MFYLTEFVVIIIGIISLLLRFKFDSPLDFKIFGLIPLTQNNFGS